MDSNDRMARADAVFGEALDLEPGDRAAFLDRACADDPDLRALVDKLIRLAESSTEEARWATGGGLAPFADAIERGIPDLSGRSLDGRYRLVREIGRGGMGTVYEARDERLDRTVAVKVLSVPAIDARTRERYLREARAAAALNHPNVVAVYDAGEADGHPYLVMEHVDGRGLDVRPPETLAEALVIAGRICDALEHAHDRGLVHRDLKPGNVLVARGAAGAEPVVKLADMGIALLRGNARVTRTGTITGTPSFMAPEQALGEPVDGRADLYALGVLLYLWIAGRLPFEGEDALAVVSQHIHAPVVPPRTFRPDLPAGLEAIVLRLLAKRPEERFATAADVRTALSAVGSPAAAHAPAHVAIEGLARGRLVARRRELDELQALWRSSGRGDGSMALISGEPGVGKTRLARELTAAARLDGATVLAGGCYENEATTPYLPFLEAFRRFVRERDDAALVHALDDSAAEIARLAPEIESRLGPFPERPQLSPQEERLRLFDHVGRFLRRQAGSRGLLFFFDDLQWADHGSLALLHYLARELASERVLFLGTYREVELDRAHPLSMKLVDWTRERLAVRVRLDRLDREATGAMVATLLGQDTVPPGLAGSLYDETEGNPFFVEEIVKALIADGGLVRARAGWRRADTGEFVLPQSVKAAIGSRIGRVSEACAEVLHTAAVLGKTFEFGELATVADRSEDELLDSLDEAVAAQLIVADRGERFAFTHDKIREVLYEELNPIRRRRLHARIATGLERLHGAGESVAVEDLAYHFVESGDDAKGLVWARRAAEAAARVFAWEEALAMLARARDCAEALGRDDEVVAIDEARGDAAYSQGEILAAAEHYERALAGCTDPDRRNAIRGKAGEVYVTGGDPRGYDHVRQALAELDEATRPRETARAVMIEARYLHLRGELEAAAGRYPRAIALAEAVGDNELLVRALSHLSGTYQHLARFDRSDGAAERCIEIGETRGLPVGILYGCEFLCENHYFRGNWATSIGYGEREETLAREIHAGERWLWSHIRALATHQAGRLEETVHLCRRGIDEALRTGERRLGLFLRMGLAACLGDLGQDAEADETGVAAVAEADEAGLVAHRIAGRGLRTPFLIDRGRLDEAVAEARTAVAVWRESGSRGMGLVYGADFAEALVVAGAPVDEIVAVLDEHLALADECAADHRRAQNVRVRGLLAAREGNADEARVHLAEALAAFERCGSGLLLRRTLRNHPP